VDGKLTKWPLNAANIAPLSLLHETQEPGKLRHCSPVPCQMRHDPDSCRGEPPLPSPRMFVLLKRGLPFCVSRLL
jgi:hypothetical protein